ncbi:MAG: glycosyltransferase family 2 protein [Patescibacteria group bacterium]|nr:glycosyltransferase family 2 protein [Patescibacteria group bacterium]
MRCSVIIVNYNSKTYLEKCLESIEDQLVRNKRSSNSFEFEVIIVNNDKQSLLLENSHSFDLHIINNEKNEGFGKAHNIGISHAQGKYIFLLNPDTLLQDSSLIYLTDQLDKHSDIGIIGPKIIEYKRKQPQPWTCGAKTNLLNIIFRNTLNKPWNKKHPVNVDWVSGTALLMRKALFEKVGGFDENFFMYFEDQDLCLHVKQQGKTIIFYPYASIIHFDGKSWNNHSKKKAVFYRSQAYFFTKHHNSIQIFFLKFLRVLMKGG